MFVNFENFTGSKVLKQERLVPFEVLTNTTNHIVGICKSLVELKNSELWKGKRNQYFVVDIALYEKWLLREWSPSKVCPFSTENVCFVLGTWHAFRHALRVLWQKGFVSRKI